MCMVPELSELDLTGVDTVAIDLETKDPNLKTLGSGSIIKVGFVCGIAIAYKDKRFYFPIRHRNKSENIAPSLIWRVLNKKIFQNKNITKVFHNAMYDVCWIRQETGLMVQGPIVDTMIAAAVIDENRYRYSLDSLGKDYLDEQKYKYDLEEVAAEFTDKPMENMDLLPYSVVKDYAEQDVNLTLKLWELFRDIIKKPFPVQGTSKTKNLENIFKLEMDLFPCLVDMRFKGVRIDVERTKNLGDKLKKKQQRLIKFIKKRTGVEIEIWAAASIKVLLDKLNIKDYETTAKSGQAKLSKSYLESHKNIYLRAIARARNYDKIINVFVNGILKFVHNGRIHAEINQIRSEKGGTVTGRFSMSKPNLQQIPARGRYGDIIRSFFLPEEGHEWGSFDYSQQEPRLVVHYAMKNGYQGVEEIAEEYTTNSKTDFHEKVANMAKITRKQAKTINLGLFYGMGKGRLAKSLELDPEDAEDLFEKYHREVPFVRKLSKGLMDYAEKNKFIFTLEDRLCHFDMWEPKDKKWDGKKGIFVYVDYVEDEETKEKKIEEVPVPVMKYKEAQDHYLAWRLRSSLKDKDPHCKEFKQYYRPAFTYKALNKLIQGSAADMTKKAMVQLYQKGIVPHIQIHDELCVSVKDDKQVAVVKETMENSIPLLIPNKVNCKKGRSWGKIK